MGGACIVDVQFACGNDKRYYAKEVAITDVEARPPMRAIRIFFKAPYSKSKLDEAARRCNAYLYANITGLNWNNEEDWCSYSDMSKLLSKTFSEWSTVYVKGHEKKRFLTDEVLLDALKVVDLGEIGCPALKTLSEYDDDDNALRCRVKRHRQDAELLCALRNVNKLHRWIHTIAGGPDAVESKIDFERSVVEPQEQQLYREKMRDYPDRVATFKDWPLQIKQRPEELAYAGFFYLGTSDCVACFHCGLGLNRWETADDPFTEHLKHAEFCKYINELPARSWMCDDDGKYDMRNYRNRLESFANRDLGHINRCRHSLEELAASGMYFYEGHAVCCECKIRVPADARAVDEILAKHCKSCAAAVPSKDVCGR